MTQVKAGVIERYNSLKSSVSSPKILLLRRKSSKRKLANATAAAHTTTPGLNSELWNNIATHLHTIDLLSLSMTCNSLRVALLRAVFQTVTFRIPINDHAVIGMPKLLSRLSKQPQLLHNIQILKLCPGAPPRLSRKISSMVSTRTLSNSSSGGASGAGGGPQRNSTLNYSILTHLTRLQTLSLSNTTLSATAQVHIFLQIPTLRTLHLANSVIEEGWTSLPDTYSFNLTRLYIDLPVSIPKPLLELLASQLLHLEIRDEGNVGGYHTFIDDIPYPMLSNFALRFPHFSAEKYEVYRLREWIHETPSIASLSLDLHPIIVEDVLIGDGLLPNLTEIVVPDGVDLPWLAGRWWLTVRSLGFVG